MMRGRREDRRCHKCSWFGHMAHYCRRKKIKRQRRKKLSCGSNRFVLLQSKVCRRIKVARSYKRKAQQIVCWRYGVEEHIIWRCPNRVAWPQRIEAQHRRVKRMEKRKNYRECNVMNCHLKPLTSPHN